MKTIKTAWLITWDWGGNSQAKVDRVAAIINGRRKTAYVKDVVELIYNLSNSTLEELAELSRYRVPQQADVDQNSHIHCGGHPALHGRLVKDLTVREDAEGYEVLEWTELAQWGENSKNEIVIVREPVKRSLKRIIQGSLSSQSNWDDKRKKLIFPERD